MVSFVVRLEQERRVDGHGHGGRKARCASRVEDVLETPCKRFPRHSRRKGREVKKLQQDSAGCRQFNRGFVDMSSVWMVSPSKRQNTTDSTNGLLVSTKRATYNFAGADSRGDFKFERCEHAGALDYVSAVL
jgi:hypothetical protein